LTPLPWIGSTKKAAASRACSAASSAARSSKGISFDCGSSGPKPFLKISSPFIDSEP
jgi:hypothetical protein